MFGCTTTTHTQTGKSYNIENIAKIVKGKTTESEVIALLGAPYNRTTTSDGKVVLSYQHGVFTRSRTSVPGFSRYSGDSSKENSVSTAIIELKDGIVTDVTSSDSKS
jgi:hypothetical protein